MLRKAIYPANSRARGTEFTAVIGSSSDRARADVIQVYIPRDYGRADYIIAVLCFESGMLGSVITSFSILAG
jgi:hypothetical protein